MIEGSEVYAKFRMQIDEDDDGNVRFAEANEVGRVMMLNTSSEDGRFLNYQIKFPRTGATGFFDVAEVQKHFEILG